MATFQDFKLQEYCNQVIKELGFKKPTPIQEKVIPLVLKNRDIIGISQTGTGKSHAFLLPIMSRIDVNKDCVQAVITAPTRELASQLFNNAKTFTKYLPELRVSLIVGGSDRQRAVNKLSRGYWNTRTYQRFIFRCASFTNYNSKNFCSR